MGFLHFSTFAQKIFREWSCNFTWSFGKVIRSKSVKMVFVTSIIRQIMIIYVFLDYFCSTIIFDQKLFSYHCDKFDYPGSIVYLSCLSCIFTLGELASCRTTIMSWSPKGFSFQKFCMAGWTLPVSLISLLKFSWLFDLNVKKLALHFLPWLNILYFHDFRA